MNWSQVGRDHGIPGNNAGQVVKEFTAKQGIDTSHSQEKNHNEAKKAKITRVSIPSNPSIRAVEAEINSMISSGRFTLGEECAPYTITKYSMVNGIMTPHDHQIQGRKVPLKEMRPKLLNKQLHMSRNAGHHVFNFLQFTL